jgi:hypothetical protein
LVTPTGRLTGIEPFRGFFTGFSDAKITVLDVNGQGGKITKHWILRGTHEREMFGIPATNKKVEIYGVTVVFVKNGTALQE